MMNSCGIIFFLKKILVNDETSIEFFYLVKEYEMLGSVT